MINDLYLAMKKSDKRYFCRLCHSEISGEPLLSMNPFPKAAQYYPEPVEFEGDTGIELSVFKCDFCDLIQLISEPVLYFKEVITATGLSEKARNARLEEFRVMVKSHGLLGKKVIEVGCGRGDMLGVLNDAGMQAVGLEYSSDLVDYARHHGRNVIQGYLGELGIEYDQTYDAFVSMNYLEHQPDTNGFLKALNKIMKDGAVGYVTVPNVNYLLRTNSLYEFVADHLVYFTAATLKRAFEINGFDVIDSRLINNENDVAVIVKKRNVAHIFGMDEVVALSAELRRYINEAVSKGMKVAVWGAGHRTLALLAISDIDNICYIVDSADFKQGKYSPVTHHKIISPAQMQKEDIDVVLVMVPGIYPDEVIKTLQSFGRNYKICKLLDNKLCEVPSKFDA